MVLIVAQHLRRIEHLHRQQHRGDRHLQRTLAQRERISTAFVESTVNRVVSKRFAKKQQMQWSKKGAHRLPQASNP
jgi:hypothetical protein